VGLRGNYTYNKVISGHAVAMSVDPNELQDLIHAFSLLSFAAAKCNGFPGMIIDGDDLMEGVHEKPISHEEDTDIEKMW
jgi:hypothetical protein